MDRLDKTHATGTARIWDNTCKPSCAAGHYKKYRVNIRLDETGTTSSSFYFKRFGWGRPSIRNHEPLEARPPHSGQG